LTDLAKALNNLATLQSKLGSHRDGVVTAQEAVAIQQELVNQGMELSIPDLATALGTLANRQAEIGQIEDALRNLEKSVNLRRDLVKRNRKAFLPDLAGILNNSAIWQSKAGRSEDALASGLEAVALRQELTDLNGKTFLPDLVQSLGALSALYMSRNEFSKATAVSRKALSLILPYFEQQPEMFSSILQDVVQGYLEACRKSTTVPDQALLARIPPISRPNRKRPPAPADGPLPNPKT
jgi:tetratricopeptide (TPR) repeat protein